MLWQVRGKGVIVIIMVCVRYLQRRYAFAASVTALEVAVSCCWPAVAIS